jgi:hypothetical protein
MKAVPGTPKSVDVVRMASWDVVAIRLCPASSKSGAIAQTLFYRADTFFAEARAAVAISRATRTRAARNVFIWRSSSYAGVGGCPWNNG